VTGNGNLYSPRAFKLQREIEQRAETVTGKRFAPHVITIKLDWTTPTSASTTAVKELENEVLVTAMDYIADHRFNIFAPVQIVTEDDIYADSIVITSSFGTERRLGQDEATPGNLLSPTVAPRLIKVFVRLSLPGADHETVLRFEPCLRLTIGRAADNNLIIDHDSVSTVHAILAMSQNGDLLVSDSGSTQGTFVNGRCLIPGELEKISALIEAGKIRPVIEKVFALEQIAEAHRLSEAGHVRGKLVVRIRG